MRVEGMYHNSQKFAQLLDGIMCHPESFHGWGERMGPFARKNGAHMARTLEGRPTDGRADVDGCGNVSRTTLQTLQTKEK